MIKRIRQYTFIYHSKLLYVCKNSALLLFPINIIKKDEILDDLTYNDQYILLLKCTY